MYLGNLFMYCGNHTANPIISSEIWSPSWAGKNSGPGDPRVSNSSWNLYNLQSRLTVVSRTAKKLQSARHN